MERFIALFRGINVGGNNLLPMKELKALLAQLGYSDVQTYIQSGNLVFDSTAEGAKEFPETVSQAIKKAFGFTPEILVLSQMEFARAMELCPFKDVEGIHCYFLDNAPNHVDLSGVLAPTESYKVVGKCFYLHAPEGIGRSKLITRLESLLAVRATGRNLKTLKKLTELMAL